MNQVTANEDALTIIRDKATATSIRWDEMRSIECYQINGNVTCLDFNCTTGGFLTADSGMKGFAQLLKTLDIYIPISLPEWRERVAAFSAEENRGLMLELYVQPETAPPKNPDNPANRFPRASAYSTPWLLENAMGPNPLWLAEWLSEVLELKAGMRVLDLGCGRGASSIFLAREFNVSVMAADVWVKPGDNAVRFAEANVSDWVTPVYAEAHALPFALGYFDAIVSFDAFHYFGTDDLYLGYISKFLRPGGRLGVVVPGVLIELEEVPEALRPYWDWEFCSFHSAAWWRKHWEKTGLVTMQAADTMEGGASLWQGWAAACATDGPPALKEAMTKEAEMLKIDAGATLSFVRVVASTVRVP